MRFRSLIVSDTCTPTFAPLLRSLLLLHSRSLLQGLSLEPRLLLEIVEDQAMGDTEMGAPLVPVAMDWLFTDWAGLARAIKFAERTVNLRRDLSMGT